MSTYKIKGAGIDTSTIDWEVSSKLMSTFDYVMTDIAANNEYLLSISPTSILIVKAGYQDWLDEGLYNHIHSLGREQCDLLLINEGCELMDSTKELVSTGLAKEIGICGSDLEKIKVTFKSMVEKKVPLTYIVIELCPFEFPLDILDWAKENDIMIISTNPMGGYLSAARNIAAFSVPYLLGFASTYSDIVLVSGRDVFHSRESAIYLKGLIGKESAAIYGLKKKVSKGIKPLKEAVQVSIKIDDEIVIPLDNQLTGVGSNFSGSLEYSIKLGKTEMVLPETDRWSDDPVGKELEDIRVLLETLHYPEDGNDDVMFSIARFTVISYLNNLFPDYEQSYSKFGKNVFIVALTKEARTVGKLWWKKNFPEITRRFVILMDGRKPHLYELQDRGLRFLKNENEDIKPNK